jgi:hypothetical protein
MTAARSTIVDPEEAGFYHCVSRCVRRAFLCGTDQYTGRCFEHRKAWVESRLLELAEIFAVGVYAFAVMSNHVHVVTYLDPGAALAWSAEEVAARWLRLFPVRERGEVDVEATRLRAQLLAANPARIAVCCARLATLSWFMRCLSEPIARRANREDACTGRFWEGRYRCQALLDDAAVVAVWPTSISIRCGPGWPPTSAPANTPQCSGVSSASNPMPMPNPFCRSRASRHLRCRSTCRSI